VLNQEPIRNGAIFALVIDVDRSHARDPVLSFGLGHLARRLRSLWAQTWSTRDPSVSIELGSVSKPVSPSSSSTAAAPCSSPSSSYSSRSPSFSAITASPTSCPSRSPSSLGSPGSSTSLPSPGHRSYVSVARVMAGQRPPSAGVPAASARPPAPGQHGGLAAAAASARPPAQATAPFAPSMVGQPGSSALFAPVAPWALQPLQPPSRQPGPPAYIPGYP
jgi:hypothetical protein